MSLHPIESLPADSRLWIFGADRGPSSEEAARLLDSVREFLEGWEAHRRKLRVGYDWRHHRFLLVAVDEGQAEASGCSVDALVRHLRGLESELGMSLVDTAPVWYRDDADGGRIRCVGRAEFRKLARGGLVDGDTTVFDLTVDRLGGLREEGWEVPARGSWHASLLPEESVSPG